MAVRNGERWIGSKLQSIRKLNYPAGRIQVIVVCDGCEDRTEEIARSAPLADLQVLTIPAGGKATALNKGMSAASGEILVFTDVRQELAPDSIRNLVACFSDPSVGAASGELVIRGEQTREEINTGLYWKYEKWIRKSLSRIDSVLGATGALYAMRASLVRPLRPETLLDDVNLPLEAFFRGYRVVLDETARVYDYPAPLKTEFRRKVRTLAGVYQTIGMRPDLLTRANRMRFHFVSHKLGRQLLPWALLVMLFSSFWLPEPWRTWMLAGQEAFYATALFDILMPERWPFKRITSPAKTFCVLMFAALCAVSIFVVPHRVLWKETQLPARTAGSA